MKSIHTSVFLIIFLFVLIPPVAAQVSFGGKPVSMKQPIRSEIQSVAMPAVDVTALLVEDEIEEAQGMPFRFGRPFEVNYDLYNSGSWEELSDGSGLWRLKISSEGAYSINLIYDRYQLPEGAELYIYSEDRTYTIGAFTSQNNKEHGRFGTAPVPGDICILEYHEPAAVRGQGELAVSHIVHAYKNLFDYGVTKELLDFGSSGSCNNNINCPEGEPWQDEKRSVAMILTSYGSRICTGTLINNVRQDRTPFFLTADHCLGGEETWVFMFNYESPDCDNIDGPTYMTVSGSTLLANYTPSDFALLTLDESPPDSYYVYYAGWSNVDEASQFSTAIHHPRGDIKKISFDYDPATSANYLTTTGTTHWRIGNWEDGTTEPGSSGSPLFDQNHRVVGQLHGGYASCTNISDDWYGKFAMSWTGGGTPSTRLVDWLDPYNSGATVLDGYDPYAGVTINHFPLEDTRDTLNDYEILCTILSDTGLVVDSLLLYYEISTVWYMAPLLPTGLLNEYTAVIPAQSAGTTINYYLFARDDAGRTDSTDVYSFDVEYTPAITVSPLSFNFTLDIGDSTSDKLIVENIGEGSLEYSIDIERVHMTSPLYDKLAEADKLEPAVREYPEGFDENYIDIKGIDDYRIGFPVEKSAGGPDLYGYYWIDSDEPAGPAFDWIDITTTGTDITAGLDDDNYTGPYEIGFEFPFYDNVYTHFYLGSNGLVGFDTTNLKSRFKVSIPNDDAPNGLLAWLWDDLDITDAANPGGQVFMLSDDSMCIIQFVDYPEYNASAGDIINAEIILEPNGTITYQYKSIGAGFDISSCAIGLENTNGDDGIETAYLTEYIKDSLALRFDRPVQWLNLAKGFGAVEGGMADTVNCIFTAARLDTGFYSDNIIITSNDPDPGDAEITIPVFLTVIDNITYMCGDPNGDGVINILDVTFLVNYLYKTGPQPEPIEAGDVDNNGECNILDVTYLVNYLYKDGPDPDCM